MYAIISEIDNQSSEKVSRIWDQLSEICGLEAIYTFPIPHFTWLVAEEMDITQAKSIIKLMSTKTSSIRTFTFGLGIFSAEQPVLYLPMVKTNDMVHLHQGIWGQMGPHCKEMNMYYSPSLWMPHITLALKDLNKKSLACAVDAYAFEKVELSVMMSSIAIAESEDKQMGKILQRFPVVHEGS